MTRRGLLLGLLATPALAQPADWPRQGLRIVSPFAPGGVTDITARLVAPGLQRELGQAVVVENRSGAGGMVGAEAVARATDGHTLFSTTGATQSILPALHPGLRYDPVRDFTPITFVARVPHVLLVPPSLGVTTLPELLALLRREPGRHHFASSGTGAIPHLAGEMFKLQAGVEIGHVPYRGSGPALADLIAGRVSLLIDALPPAIGHVRGGQLRAVAAGTRTRIQALPDVPTMAEQGLPNYESYTWSAIYMPGGTPPAVVERLHAALSRVLRAPETASRIAELGAELVVSTPAELAAIQQAEYLKWGAVIHGAGVKPEP